MGSEDPQLPITSSAEPDWPADARSCYEDALRALIDPRIAFVVGGAFAVHTHTGIWRTTKDLDLLLTARDLPWALDHLAAKGFETYVKDPIWLAKARRGDYFVDLITGIGNASLAVDPSWIERAVSRHCAWTALQSAGRGRAHRFEDLRRLSRTLRWRRCRPSDSGPRKNARLDRLLHLTGSHWELLFWSLVLFAYVYPAHTDDVPGTHLGRFDGQVLPPHQNPSQNAPFRGTLVDPRMFAIDVNEWGERNLYKEYCDQHPG